MPRLPKPGADVNQWGDILNEFLQVSHEDDGSLKTTLLADKLDAGARGTANGVAPLDGGAVVPAANMRNFTDRGLVQANTAYAKWDTVIYNGRRILMTAAYTSNSSSFISAANYVQLGGMHIFYAYDYGFRADGSQASAGGNVTALQNAINAAAALNGGTVVLPFGYGFINAPIELKNRVWLQGSSTYATVLQLANDANCHMVTNHVSTNGTSDPNAMWCGLLNLTLDGRRTAQTGGGTYHGVYFNTNPFNTAASSDLAFDPTYLLYGVHVRNSQANGIHINGRSDARIGYCKVSFTGAIGYRSSFDTHFDHCISESTGTMGFLAENSSVQFVGCKAYKSGQVTPALGHGFVVRGNGIGEIALSGCDAQQVSGYGFSIEQGAVAVSMEGCNVSQSSYLNGTTFCAYNLDNASFCTLTGTSQNTVAANAIRIAGGADKNILHVTHTGSGVGEVLTSDTVLLANYVVANGGMVSSLQVKGSPSQDILVTKTSSNGNAMKVDTSGNVVAYQKLSVGAVNAPHTFSVTGSFGMAQTTLINTATTLSASHCLVLVGQAVTVTLPSTAGAGGRLYSITNISSGSVTVEAAATQQVCGAANVVVPAGGSLLIFAYGTAWYRFGSTI